MCIRLQVYPSTAAHFAFTKLTQRFAWFLDASASRIKPDAPIRSRPALHHRSSQAGPPPRPPFRLEPIGLGATDVGRHFAAVSDHSRYLCRARHLLVPLAWRSVRCNFPPKRLDSGPVPNRAASSSATTPSLSLPLWLQGR